MRCGSCILSSGILILVLSVGLGWFGIPYVLRYQVVKASQLDPSTELYAAWVETPPNVELYLKFYFFNVTNPNEIVQEKAKPVVNQMGPFVFREIRVKENIEKGTTEGTIQYRQKRFLSHVQELSQGELNDELTFLNFPLVNAGKFAIQLTKDKIVHRMVEEMLIHGRGESLFRTQTVQELMFDGFPVKSFLDLLSDHTLALVGDVPPVPEVMKDGLFALYEGRNGSDDGLYEIDTGKKDPSNLGKITKWNGDSKLPWYKCDTILGTDGTIFPPFLKKDQPLNVYNPEICRSRVLEFEKEVSVSGAPAWRFTPTSRVFASPNVNPENACYCLEEDPSFCDKEGFLIMSGCTEGHLVMYSNPHFYGADPEYAEAIVGIQPEKETHETFMDIEPITATTFRAAKRLQMNFEVTAWPTMPYFAQLKRNITFPLMWVEESVTPHPEILKKFIMLSYVLKIVEMGKWIMPLVGFLFFLLGILVRQQEASLEVKIF